MVWSGMAWHGLAWHGAMGQRIRYWMGPGGGYCMVSILHSLIHITVEIYLQLEEYKTIVYPPILSKYTFRCLPNYVTWVSDVLRRLRGN